jgi:hypothetical protein
MTKRFRVSRATVTLSGSFALHNSESLAISTIGLMPIVLLTAIATSDKQAAMVLPLHHPGALHVNCTLGSYDFRPFAVRARARRDDDFGAFAAVRAARFHFLFGLGLTNFIRKIKL